MVKLHSKTPNNTIPVRELKDGQIGIITLWWGERDNDEIGRIVQRHDKKLIVLGEPQGESYSNISQDDTERVRVLEKGELIEIC